MDQEANFCFPKAANGGLIFVAGPHRTRMRGCVADVATTHFATSGPHAIHGEFLVGRSDYVLFIITVNLREAIGTGQWSG